MKAFFAIVRASFQLSLQFRADILSWMFLDSVPFLVLVTALRTILHLDTTTNGFHIDAITHYFLGVFLVSQLCSTYLENTRAEEIRMGKIDFDLTKPYSFLVRVVASDIGEKLIHLLFLLPLVVFFFSQAASFSAAFIGMMLFLASYGIQLILALWVMMSTFWIQRAQGMSHLVMITLSFFSGAMLPPQLIPSWLLTIISTLPFKFAYMVPIQATQGSINILPNAVYLLAFFGFLLLVTSVLWREGVKRYSSAGG